MDWPDVARRLGMIRSPAQTAYRAYRRDGLPRDRARALTVQGGAAQVAQSQTLAVQAFVHQHAVWSIPDAAWPRTGDWTALETVLRGLQDRLLRGDFLGTR